MEDIKASSIANKIDYYSYNESLDHIKNNTNWLKKSCAVMTDKNHKTFGIISEADILEIEKTHSNLKAVRGWEKCNHDIISVKPDSGIKEVIKLMLDNNIHHVLVLDISDNDDKYDGIISSIDILKVLYDKI
jgi:predicted transcriptional regulator